MNIGIIVQCRMTSARLPGKVLRLVVGKPMLQYTLERLGRCRSGQVVVATSAEDSDRPIVDFCRDFGMPCHTGSLRNVALRIAGAVTRFGFDCFVRVCGDSPLIDQRLVDRALELYAASPCPMVTNVRKRTFPKGQSVEVLDSRLFVALAGKMTAPEEQEHVTPYCYMHLKDSEILNFESGGDYGAVQQSVDTEADLLWVRRVVGGLERPHWDYTYLDILAMER